MNLSEDANSVRVVWPATAPASAPAPITTAARSPRRRAVILPPWDRDCSTLYFACRRWPAVTGGEHVRIAGAARAFDDLRRRPAPVRPSQAAGDRQDAGQGDERVQARHERPAAVARGGDRRGRAQADQARGRGGDETDPRPCAGPGDAARRCLLYTSEAADEEDSVD